MIHYSVSVLEEAVLFSLTSICSPEFELDDGSDSDPDTHTNPERRIHELKAELEVASLALADCRAIISKQLNDADVVEPGSDPGSREPRDDDRQYFQSYEENGMPENSLSRDIGRIMSA
jgi:hypothetical protein